MSRVYGASDPTLGVTYSGFVNGETSSVLGGTLSVVDSKAATTTAVGSYSSVITGSGQTSTNYTIAYVAGTLAVTPAALTITASSVSRVYGASDPTLGATYSGFVNGETSSMLGGTLSVVDSKAATTTAVGSYTSVITASGQTSTNYTITYVAGNLTVSPDALSISASGLSRVYGASDPTMGVTYSGFVNGETSIVLGGTASVVESKAATTTSVATYTGVITGSGQTSTNYTIKYVAGNLAVTPAALTITASGVSRVYGASDPTLGVTYSGFVNGETSSVLGGTLSVVDSKAATTTAVGSYTSAITASGQTSTNYTITYVAGSLAVTPAALTITASGVSRVYGASDPTLGVTYSGFVNGETSSVLGGTLSVVDSKAATTTAVGSYTSVITASGQTSTNYTITYVAGNLTVTPAALTITASSVSRVYGASDPTLGVTYSGFVNGETSSVLGGTLSVVDSKAATTTAVGSYTSAITASGQTSTNYTITYVAGNLAVTPAALTITASGVSRVYGASDPTLGVTYSGFVNGETSSVLGGTLSVVDSKAAPTTALGSYTGVITASGRTSTNYTITYAPGNLTVTPASLTVTANSTTKTYGQTVTFAGTEFTTAGLVNSDSVSSVSLSSTGALATAPVAGSPYTIVASNASGSGLSNYTISYVTGSLTVIKASPTITTTPSTSAITLGTSTVNLKDTAVLSGGSNETGTLTFTLYLGSTLEDTETVAVAGNGSYTTPTGHTLPTTSTVTGTYQWDSAYGGDSNNKTASDLNDGQEQVKVSPAIPSISTVPGGTSSLGNLTIAGTKYLDQTGNGFSSDDTPQSGVTIDLYAESNSSAGLQAGSGGDTLVASTTTASNGTYNFSVTSAGTYYVQESVPAGYVQTGGGPNGSAGNAYYTIVASSGHSYSGYTFDDYFIPTCAPNNVSYQVTTPSNYSSTVSNLVGNTQQGDTVTATFTVPSGMNDQLTLVSYTAPGPNFSDATAYQQVICQQATGTFAPGTHSITVQVPNSDYQIDFVCGPTISQFEPNQNGNAYGPDSAVILYHAQNRFISGDSGGTTTPTPTPTPTPPLTPTPTVGTGQTLSDSATLSGGFNPTGTIIFYLFAPGVTPIGNDTNNVYSDTVTVSGNGSYATSTGTNPGGYMPTVSGTYQWVAVYSADGNNSPVAGSFGSEPETVGVPTPSITTAPNPSIVPLGTAANLTDTATLAGGANPTGTITFTLNQGITKLVTETVPVTGDGLYTTPTSYSLSSSVSSGVYQWNASYSGDANNNATSDNNDPAEQVTVVSPCCNLLNVGYSVYNPANLTTTTPADLSGNTQQGDLITVTFTVPTGNYEQISLVSYNAQEGFYNINDANLQTVFQSVTQVEGPGTHTLSIALPPNFYQLDFVCGTVITTLGPIATNPNNFYHAQNRYIDGDNGGVTPAGSGVLSVTGEVYNDVNVNGKLDSGDQALGNMTVTLTGTDSSGSSISATATTNSSGVYSFSGLPFSNSTGYAVTVSSPSGYTSAAAAVGTVNSAADGTAATTPEGIQGIVLGSSTQRTGTGYNLGLVSSSDLSGGVYSIVVLSPTANGALTVSGTAKVNVPGAIVVDSSSSTAISGSGTASLTASIIDAVGSYQKASGEAFSPLPSTGAAMLADPLAGLAAPSTSGLTNYGSVNLTTGSQTIKPGIYGSIKVSNSASLTMNAGTYIIEGGGFSVSGSANVAGSGVTIYNAGSNCPSAGGTYGSINLSSSGTFNLSAPSTGSYAGILIFQSRDNIQTSSINVSGKPGSAITGTIYAASAQLVDGGTTPITGSLIVNLLTVSTGAVANSLDNPDPGVAYSPTQVLSAYGINNLALDGSGQTIAIVDAYDNPDIFSAVDAFDNQFGLTGSGPLLYNQYGPASSFLTVQNQDGQLTSPPPTDPNGPGTDNWEVEESLDVEWAHAVAPGAQIVLVEANSQSLPDLMTAVATAAGQPGVSVVSMTWGFAEGQAVFAADEANYDSTFNVPGVTFVASTGDYGAADPEYPAFSPNVVAVGGTSLNLNSNNSINSETGWGYNSASAGEFIGSGGGISMYEPEPAYQEGVQSTGSRTTPDVSLVADPATGAWIADPYNLGVENPFEVVGGTSLSAPAWAGLLALVNQGREAAGEAALDSSSPTEAQQALYSLPQSNYNVISSGSNGYTANAGYNLVTGLGTPVANLLVENLVAYQGPGTTYDGPTVGVLQNTTLVNTGSSDGGSTDVFNVFDAITVSSTGLGYGKGPGAASPISTPTFATPAQDVAASHSMVPTVTTLGTTFGLAPGSLSQNRPVQAVGWEAYSSSVGQNAQSPAAVTITPVSASLITRQSAWTAAQSAVSSPLKYVNTGEPSAMDREELDGLITSRARTGVVSDAVLNELAADASVLWPAQPGNGTITIPVIPADRVARGPAVGDPLPRGDQSLTPTDFAAGLSVLGMATGLWARGKGLIDGKKRRWIALSRLRGHEPGL